MLKYSIAAFLGLLCIISCQQEAQAPSTEIVSELSQQIDAWILGQIESENVLFNWNDQSDDLLCAALPLTDFVFSVGYETNMQGKNNVEQYIDQYEAEIEWRDRNDKLGVFSLRTMDCNHLAAIKDLNGVQYVELDYFPTDPSMLISPWSTDDADEGAGRQDLGRRGGNPGAYEVGNQPYLTYLQGIDGGSVDRAYNENMDKVYHELGYYGTSTTGIAVIDNGVKEDQLAYFSVGPGGYEADGYFIKNFGNPAAVPDGPHPQSSDLFGIWQLIEPAFNHGTGMSENVYSIAPFAHRMTLRASPTYILAAPNQMRAITNAIVAMADDPDIKVVSMSMAGVMRYNQMASAIRYFNSKNKIMVSAAGSTLPILKDLLGVLYPARLSETVSVTGIDELEETNGQMQLGLYAHGGPQNDFIIEGSESSSTATSTFAAMLGVIWSINPDLDREALIQIMIDHSTFNLQQGSKHQIYGWGKVDMYEAALAVEETL